MRARLFQVWGTFASREDVDAPTIRGPGSKQLERTDRDRETMAAEIHAAVQEREDFRFNTLPPKATKSLSGSPDGAAILPQRGQAVAVGAAGRRSRRDTSRAHKCVGRTRELRRSLPRDAR